MSMKSSCCCGALRTYLHPHTCTEPTRRKVGVGFLSFPSFVFRVRLLPCGSGTKRPLLVGGPFPLAEEIKALFQCSTHLSSSKVNNPVLQARPVCWVLGDRDVSSDRLCSDYLYLRVDFREERPQ